MRGNQTASNAEAFQAVPGSRNAAHSLLEWTPRPPSPGVASTRATRRHRQGGTLTVLRTAWRRIALTAAALAVASAVALIGGIGWYYADQIEEGALRLEREPEEYDLTVAALGDGRVTLQYADDGDPFEGPGTMGLEWPGGYGRVGEIVEADGRTAVRVYAPMEGALRVGDAVRLDKLAFPGDPERAHGIRFRDVDFAENSTVGPLRAWEVAGADDTWVVFVHGKGSDRREALRMLPAVHGAGFPSLVITYRNDDGAPEDPTSYYQYGLTEWEDLDAAVRYALDRGAADVVVVGYSMGGGIIASFLHRSAVADRVVGAILDSPMLDFGATVDLAAEDRGLPALLTAIAKVVSSIRFGIDWQALDYLALADGLAAPVLLFHGSGDERVPVETSEAFAASRPDLVTYVPVEGASHVGAWNVDPEAYEAAVRGFLERVAR